MGRGDEPFAWMEWMPRLQLIGLNGHGASILAARVGCSDVSRVEIEAVTGSKA